MSWRQEGRALLQRAAALRAPLPTPSICEGAAPIRSVFSWGAQGSAQAGAAAAGAAGAAPPPVAAAAAGLAARHLGSPWVLAVQGRNLHSGLPMW